MKSQSVFFSSWNPRFAIALCALILFARPSRLSGAYLYVGDVEQHVIYKFAPDGTGSVFKDHFEVQAPAGLAFDAAGNLYEADGSAHINKFTPSGIKSQFAMVPPTPFGLAFDSSGNLFASQQRGSGLPTTIYKISPSGVETTFATGGLGTVVGLAFDSSGNLLVADQDAGTIYKYAATGSRSVFASGLSQPFGLAFDAKGNLFEGDSASGKIFKFSPSGSRTLFASGLRLPCGLAFDPSGNLFVTETVVNGNVYEFTPTGTRSTFVNGIVFGQPYYLAFAPVPEPSCLILTALAAAVFSARVLFKTGRRSRVSLKPN